MFRVVDALHERNIIHQNMKLKNIFITKNNNFKLNNNIIYLYVYLFVLIIFFFFFVSIFFVYFFFLESTKNY
jgi:serine/threonine protein kinase